MPAQPVAIGDTYYVYQLLERRHEEKPMDDAAKTQMREQLLAAAKNDLMSDWLSWRQSKADIWINEELLK